MGVREGLALVLGHLLGDGHSLRTGHIPAPCLTSSSHTCLVTLHRPGVQSGECCPHAELA